VREATLVLRARGQRQAEVRAAHVEVSRDLRLATFRGVAQAALYDRDRVVLRVRAEEITLDRKSSDLRARGGLLLESPEGFQLVAPEGQWLAASRQLVFPSGIAVRGPHLKISARRLVADVALQSLVLDGAVDITFRVGGGTR
jgi:lipopolysaccharide assembly outer membrane protein LptD (OstA)